MNSIKVALVAGARPNFMKVAPVIHAIKKHNTTGHGIKVDFKLVHTGQHYDSAMSDNFFRELNIPEPDTNLNVGSGTQAEQTAKIMVAFESYLLSEKVDLVIVVGDVTSTMACTIAAKKLNVPVAHIEGGIRSGDMTMPEEVNRIVTDSISDFFFVTTTWAKDNLLKEGKSAGSIDVVGNTMVDTLLSKIDNLVKPEVWDEAGLEEKKYLVLTLHRPSNVDNEEVLTDLLNMIESAVGDYRILFPVHPRTQKKLGELKSKYTKINFIEPQSYLRFIYLVKNALGVVTDSGGITEETTMMHIPCITLRNSTERPETCDIGSNVLVGNPKADLSTKLKEMVGGNWKKSEIPPLWDGKTSERIVELLIKLRTNGQI